MEQFDFESIRNEMVEKLENKMQGTISVGSSARRIIDIIAEKLAQVVRYTEYLTRESKWSLAQNASSILTQLELFGYNPHRKIGASGFVEVSTDPNFSTTYPRGITIPKFTRFSNGEFTFCSTREVYLSSEQNSVQVPVIQGNLNSLTFKGTDINNYRYQIMNNSIENSLYELIRGQINGIVMVEVDSFGDSQIAYNDNTAESGITLTQRQYEYKLRNIQGFEGIELQFPSGDEYISTDSFIFRYLVTEGISGNVSAIDSVTTPLDTFTDDAGVSVRLYCRNTAPLTGGEDYESIDDMRENAPLAFNRVDKIITRNDYISAIRQQILGASVFYIWTEQEANQQIAQFYDAYDFINNSRIFICGCSFDSEERVLTPVSQNYLLEVNNSLKEQKGLTDYFVAQEPSIIQFFLTGEVFFDGTLTNAISASTEVGDKLVSSFDADHLEFFKSLYHSNYIALLEELDDLDHVDVKINLYMVLQMIVTSSDSSVTLATEALEFGFTTSIDGRFYITLYNPQTRSLVKDIAYVEEAGDGEYNWYDIEGGSPLQSIHDDYIGWENNSQTPATGTFGPLIIKGRYQKILTDYANDHPLEDSEQQSSITYPAGLVVRFVPYNEDASLINPNQILTLTDAHSTICVWEEPPYEGYEGEGKPIETLPDTYYSSNKEYSLIFTEVTN